MGPSGVSGGLSAVSVAQAELLFEPTGYPAAAFRIAPAASTTSTTMALARYGGLSLRRDQSLVNTHRSVG